MRRQALPVLLFLVAAVCGVSTAGLAQQDVAAMTGVVRDAAVGAVPGATVTVVNTRTNIPSSTVTSPDGSYTFPSLRPGAYKVIVELDGFSKIERSVTLEVAQRARLDFTLQAPGHTETVTVVANLSPTDSGSPRGTVIDGRTIDNIPLNGRDFTDLFKLVPGVSPPTPRLASVGFVGAVSVNGNRPFSNVFLLDGVDNISISTGFRGENVQLVQPSVEALQEFKVQTNAYSAEYGRGSGAVITSVIKSGSNSLRGSVYEFLRNDKMDAANFFTNALGQEKPKRERNQFGAAAGGPIKRSRTFWFADYEGLRDKEGVPRVRLVPTEAEKKGLFSSVVVDPFAPGRPAFPQNGQGQWVIPEDRWDPVGAAIVRLIPSPNATLGGQPIYASSPVTDTRRDQFDVRLDHQVASNLSVFGRYSFVDSLTFRPAPLPGLAEGSFNDAFGANDNRSQGLALGATWTISPSFVGEFRFGAARGDYYTNPPNDGRDGPAEIGLKGVPDDPTLVGGLPKMNLQGFDAIGRHTSTPQFQTPRSFNPRATFSLVRGPHFVKFGGEYLDVSTKINDLNAPIGRMNFDNRFTNRAIGDLLLGLPSQLALTSYTVMDQGQNMQFYFVQDDYRISDRLTANLGLRYEFATPPMEKDNSLANFDPVTGTMMFARDGSIFDRSLIHPDRNNFAPRLGFAYQAAKRLVVRGAYGIFYNHTVRQGREGLLGFNPPYLVDNLLQTSVTGNAAVASAAPFRLVDGYPSGLLDPNSLSPTVGRRAQDPNQRTPYVQQYNIGTQYELRPDLVLDVAFVGNKGTKLPGFRNLNQRAVITNPDGSQSAGARPYPAFGDIQWMENRVSSVYTSVQTSLQKRFDKGLSALVSYTWGRAMAGAPDHISTSGGGIGFDTGVFREPQDGNNLRAEYGPTEFDITHRFVASYVWELPFGNGRHFGRDWKGATEFLLGGWQLSGVNVAQSGLALTATLAGSSVLNIGGERRARPNLVGNPELPASERTLTRWFNTDAFAAFAPGQQAFGNAGVGIMRGPDYVNFDFTLAKNFQMPNHRYVQFRTELFNALNHPNFGPPNLQRESSGFGQIVTASNGRIVQLGLKFYF